jgi:palmitoyltransferase
VLKLDHFCPWIGGIVSEQSMKFFILFNSYTFFYTIFDWVLAAVCISARDRQRSLDGNLIAMLILGLLFMGLTGGIGFSAILNALTNHTTPENTAEPSGHTWNMALRVPKGKVVVDGVRTITFPDLRDGDFATLQKLLETKSSDSSAVLTTPMDQRTAHVERPRVDAESSTAGHTFALVESDQFPNPWDCGAYINWCQVMGHSILGWFVPMFVGRPWFSHHVYAKEQSKRSGDGVHSTFFPTGIDVKIMKARAGLIYISPEEVRDYELRLHRRQTFPYLLGEAGAPRVGLNSSLKIAIYLSRSSS